MASKGCNSLGANDIRQLNAAYGYDIGREGPALYDINTGYSDTMSILEPETQGA